MHSFYHIIFIIHCKQLVYGVKLINIGQKIILWRNYEKFQKLSAAPSEYSAVFSDKCFSKLASIQYNKNGLHAPLLYVFLFLMIANCGIYAIAWQQVIKNSHCPPPMPTKVSIFCGHRSGQSQFFMNSFPYRTSSES